MVVFSLTRTSGLRWVLAFGVPVLLFGLSKHVGLGLTVNPQAAAPRPADPPALKSSVDDTARQVTVFAIQATPGPATIDPRLGSVRAELRKVLPGHGFELLTVESKRLEAQQSVTCDLGRGYKAETVLVEPMDELGKVHLRCILSKDGKPEFSTLVKTPINQLFFYERKLDDSTRVMIGVGARDIMGLDLPRSEQRPGTKPAS